MSKITQLENLAKSGISFYDTQEQLKNYVYGLSNAAFEKGNADRDKIQNSEQLLTRQEFIRENFIKSLGGLPNSDAPLNAKIIETLAFDGYKVEKIIYESRPQSYVTANLYIPNGIDKPSAAILFVCGHHSQGKHVAEYQIVCQYLVRAGLIVLAQDPIGQGERFSYYEQSLGKEVVRNSTDDHDYAGFQCVPLDDSIAKYFLHDCMRGIDYLCTRLEVDNDKIGITGNSGGGTQTSMVMLADRRICVAAPAAFIMDRKSFMETGQPQDREQIWPNLTKLGIDHEDIILSVAPKPVLILAVNHDFFPIESTTQTYSRCKRFWKLSNNQDDFEFFCDDSDHMYTRKMSKKSAAFFATHLLGKDNITIDDSTISPIEESKLWCTKSGQISVDFSDAKFVYHENIDALNKILHRNSLIDDLTQQDSTRQFLIDKIYQNRISCELFLKRTTRAMDVEDLLCDSLVWHSQKEIVNHAYVFRHLSNKDVSLPVTITLWEGGTTCLQYHYDYIRSVCLQNRAVMVLDVTGIGRIEQRSLSTWAAPLDFCGTTIKLNDDLTWLGDSLLYLRLYDILRSIEVINNCELLTTENLVIHTHGRYSVYADICAFLEPKITNVTSEWSFDSYTNFIQNKYYNPYDIAGFIAYGILNYADLDSIRQWYTKKQIK